MSKTARCPSCGAPVEFKSVVSVLAVCDYCQSTLVRHGEELENLGTMAALIEDRSPLQRGAEGRWQGRHFGLIGRLQLRYAQGLWNEWHLLFDDGQSGWLAEAGGEYVLSFPRLETAKLPSFETIEVGQTLALSGHAFAVTNKLVAECVAGEGELPFKVGAGYPAPVIDLRDEQGGFATLDYSDAKSAGDAPLVFIGSSVGFESLGWANLRDTGTLQTPTLQARSFACPNCGAARSITHEGIVRMGCTSCGALLDTGDATVKLIERVKAKMQQPRLPLGSRGTLRGAAVEIIGYLRRCMQADGIEYCWDEYVCLGKDNALLWLTEYDGHWSLARTLDRSIAANAEKATVGNEAFRHFQNYAARVQFVLGEFPWQVKVGERVQVSDYVAPPHLLSRETTDSERTWSLAEYVEPDEIAAAFVLELPLPSPRGAYANQPNPHVERHRSVCRRFWSFFLIAFAIHLVLLAIVPGGTLLEQSLIFSPADDEAHVTPEFRLDAETARLEVVNEAGLNNNWVGLGLTLVNKDTGQNWQALRELSYYSGVDGGESWSEGSRSNSIVFQDLPPGAYLLAIEPELDPASPPVADTLRVAHAGPRWSSLLLVTIFLAIFPIITRLRQYGFEVRRWAESDHPLVTESDDDD